MPVLGGGGSVVAIGKLEQKLVPEKMYNIHNINYYRSHLGKLSWVIKHNSLFWGT